MALPMGTMLHTPSWSRWEGMEVPGGAPGHRPQARRRAHLQPPQRAGAAGERQGDLPLAAISSRKLQPDLAAGSGNQNHLSFEKVLLVNPTAHNLQ